MEDDGVVKMLYSETQIAGRKVWVFECGVAPRDAYGSPDHMAFANDCSSNRNVYYEASDMDVKWFRSPFFTTKTAPTDDELKFQLEKYHQGRGIKFVFAGIAALFVLYQIFT